MSWRTQGNLMPGRWSHGQVSKGRLHADRGGSTFMTLGAMLDFGLRAGLEYRRPAGLGVEVAVGSSIFWEDGPVITGEAFAVLPLFRLGRSGALDLALGVPDLFWVLSAQACIVSVGAAARLRFALSSWWSRIVRAGAGYPFFFGPTGGARPVVWPDLGIGAAFRL
jgi:hypothetical protein